jgi:hypothetical protein
VKRLQQYSRPESTPRNKMWLEKHSKDVQVVDAEVAVSEDAQSISGDDERLISMGKKPQLKRIYNFWTCMFETPNLDNPD